MPNESSSRTVLLVEDDEMVRELCELALLRIGFHILSAGDAQQALLLSEQYAGQVDLIVCDLNLPRGADGRDLVRKVTALSPRAQAIYMSGAPVTPRPDAPAEPFLHKPFTPSTLGALVRAVMDEK